jgi:hypothetical protein
MTLFDRFLRATVCALCIGLFGASALAQSNSSAPAPFTKAAATPVFLLAVETAAVALRLDPIDPAIIDAARRSNGIGMNKQLQIGVGRDVDPALQAASESLAWVAVPGGIAARMEVTSPGARALRIGLSAANIGPGIELRFAGRAQPATVYGPFNARDVDGTAPTYWSPVLEGETGIVELFIAAGASVVNNVPVVTQVSHLFVSPADPRAESLAKAIGDSGFCEVNLICRSSADTALANTGRAVARMTFQVASGGTALCTGTLLNPSGGSFIPYFYSAAHCISTQSSASTLTTHWFYDSTSCGSNILSSSYVQLTGGATLLYANTDTDPLFMRLNATPPQGAFFAGWDAATLGNGTAVVAVHHPKGDLKKVSLGTMGGFNGGDASPFSGSTFIIVNWNSLSTGVTEGGSSGSGIFTSNGSGYRLRGGLQGGPSSCFASGSDLQDYYSRFDLAYPQIAQYLSPASTGAANYTALWWNPNESGWGLNLNHQADTIFGTLFDYDLNGTAMWLVSTMTKQSSSNGIDSYAGDLLRTTGPAFNASPFTPIDGSNVTTVGAMAVALSGNIGGLAYSVNGATVSKSIEKQLFASRLPTCVGTTGDRSSLTNYQDLWWGGQNESGWGINLTHEGDTIFATLFTYASGGGTHNPGLWLVTTASRQSDGSYLGDLLRTTGPPFNANPFTPIGSGNITTVGTMRFRFTNGTTGTLTYVVNGATVVKTITRQVFGTPMPACTS